MKFKIGLDLGGTKIETVVLDPDHKIIYRDRLPTEALEGSDKVLENVKYIYTKAVNFINNKNHTLGIGIPGYISNKTGLLNYSTIQCHNGLNPVFLFKNLFQRDFSVENDANCFAFAEAIIGVGQKYTNIFGLIIGTGCGAGIVFNKNLIRGNNNLAGEFGHSILKMNGRSCFCGKKGCVNAYISGTAVQKEINKISKDNITIENFFNKSRLSIQENKIKEDFFDFLQASISNIINIIDPDVIILGGGLSNLDVIYSRLNLGNKYFDTEKKDIEVKIIKNSLGDSAGVLGAALLGK
jgi:fructokinase